MHLPRTVCNVFLISLLVATSAFAAEIAKPADAPTILSVSKIWDAGNHNAFTDLLWLKDHWLCTFRESQAHVGGEGKLRVLTSPDGKTWSSIALIAEAGIDLRDPKISETPDGRLMMLAGGSVYEGKKLLGKQPRVAFSSDGGKTWTPPQRVLTEGDWLWRLTWHEGRAYGVAYRDGKVKLYSTADGVQYDKGLDLAVTELPNESTVRFTDKDEMIILVRRETGDTNAWVGTAMPPYTELKWTELPQRVGGPNFLVLPDGTMWAAGRDYTDRKKQVTSLARFALPDQFKWVLTFPSGGDCSYPGMVIRDGVLYMSYYSSHEGKTSIYFAEVKLR